MTYNCTMYIVDLHFIKFINEWISLYKVASEDRISVGIMT